MNKNPSSKNPNSENRDSDVPPFEKLEKDVCELRLVVERQLDSIVRELKRAEARDEWMTQQITESRRLLLSQTQTLDEIQTAIQHGVRGLS